MKEAAPSYYHKFKCVAGACNHSCCIGWEIDIDEETMAFYESLPTHMGERIRKSIEGDVPHFILGQGERCPFLNDKGLCDIICECGEEALCEICSLHPRFRNFYESFAEIGLGLCCEEAARLILSEKEKVTILMVRDTELTEEEATFLARRQGVFNVLQDRSQTVGERFSALAKEFHIDFNFSLEKLRKVYISLERLDEAWTEELQALKNFSFDQRIFEENAFQIIFEQLAVYFIFRYFGDAMWDGGYRERVIFALVSCYIIGALCARRIKENHSIDFETVVNLVRMYSAEIEYSEENVERLMQEDIFLI